MMVVVCFNEWFNEGSVGLKLTPTLSFVQVDVKNDGRLSVDNITMLSS